MLVKYFISPIFLHFWGHSISAVTRVSTFTFLPSVFNSSPGGSAVGDCDAINVFLHHQELHLNLFLPFFTTIDPRFLSFFLLLFFVDSDCSLILFFYCLFNLVFRSTLLLSFPLFIVCFSISYLLFTFLICICLVCMRSWFITFFLLLSSNLFPCLISFVFPHFYCLIFLILFFSPSLLLVLFSFLFFSSIFVSYLMHYPPIYSIMPQVL